MRKNHGKNKWTGPAETNFLELVIVEPLTLWLHVSDRNWHEKLTINRRGNEFQAKCTQGKDESRMIRCCMSSWTCPNYSVLNHWNLWHFYNIVVCDLASFCQEAMGLYTLKSICVRRLQWPSLVTFFRESFWEFIFWWRLWGQSWVPKHIGGTALTSVECDFASWCGLKLGWRPTPTGGRRDLEGFRSKVLSFLGFTG